METIRAAARKRMQGYCRVCPVCNGVACAGEVPGMGGLGKGASFRANFEALAAYRLEMRLLHDVSAPQTTVSLPGLELDLPLLAAPIGGVSFNMDGLGEGVAAYINAPKNELQSAMVLTGCPDAAAVRPDILRPPAA